MKAFKNVAKRLTVALGLILGLSIFAGCDETMLSMPDMGFGDYGLPMDFGVGPIDWDVFNNANDAWSDYFRS